MAFEGTWQTAGRHCPLTGGVCLQQECAWWCPAHDRRPFGTCAVTLNAVQNGTIINTIKHRLGRPGEVRG